MKATFYKLAKALAVVMSVLIISTSYTNKPALAWCCACENCGSSVTDHLSTGLDIVSNYGTGVSETITWFFSTLWMENLLPSMLKIAQEATLAARMNQASIGAMLDGVTHNKKITQMQVLKARTARDQTPAVSMCKFASLSSSLAAADAKASATQNFINKRAQERIVGAARKDPTVSSFLYKGTHKIIDQWTRFDQFLDNYCDKEDFQATFGLLEQNLEDQVTGYAKKGCNGLRPNRDINFNQLIDSPLTLNIDYTDADITIDEQDVMAMNANLFSTQLYSKSPSDFANKKNNEKFMRFRGLLAKRNVAQHSFSSIVALKASGGENTAAQEQMRGLLREMGLPDAEINNLLTPDQYGSGNVPAPSYYAQMELLTQKLFQDPAFYANLYDTPANVERQYAAMQALGLMQRREAYESMMRSELLTSLLLEFEVEDAAVKLK